MIVHLGWCQVVVRGLGRGRALVRDRCVEHATMLELAILLQFRGSQFNVGSDHFLHILLLNPVVSATLASA